MNNMNINNFQTKNNFALSLNIKIDFKTEPCVINIQSNVHCYHPVRAEEIRTCSLFFFNILFPNNKIDLPVTQLTNTIPFKITEVFNTSVGV